MTSFSTRCFKIDSLREYTSHWQYYQNIGQTDGPFPIGYVMIAAILAFNSMMNRGFIPRVHIWRYIYIYIYSACDNLLESLLLSAKGLQTVHEENLTQSSASSSGDSFPQGFLAKDPEI